MVDHYTAAVPAHKAAYGGHAVVLRLLADAPGFDAIKDAQGPYNGYTPLHDAVRHGDVDAADVLVSAGARTDLQGSPVGPRWTSRASTATPRSSHCSPVPGRRADAHATTVSRLWC